MRLFGKSRRSKHRSHPPKRRVLFVSHEATRTGAPKIILNILKNFRQRCDIQCETLLLKGGHLASEFQHYSTTDCFNLQVNNQDDIRRRVTKAVNREKGNTPILAICNSMESRYVAAALQEHNIPCISLVHELPSSYEESDYDVVFGASQKVVFPVHTVRDAADAKTPLPPGKSIVLPQGLLNPEFGKRVDKEKAQQSIRQELGIAADAFVVLGCGTLDLRKGIDHFASIARTVLSSKNDRPIHFVWVGEGPRWTHSIHHYVELDLKKTRFNSNVHFIGEREEVEPYFVGSDVFLMCSRVDPFPCVIHEAMASSLPIIAFANSGGAPEAIDNGAGFIVDYADYNQAAATIKMIASDPQVVTGITERALSRVETRYCFQDYVEKLIDLSESVAHQRLRTVAEPFSYQRAA